MTRTPHHTRAGRAVRRDRVPRGSGPTGAPAATEVGHAVRHALGSRRVVALLALAVLSGCGSDARQPASAARDTTRATLTDPDGNAILDRTGGERVTTRTDVAPASPRRATLVTLAQLSDLHVRDEESPGRVPFLDRYSRPFDPTFRPQEALSAQVAAAAIRAVGRERPDATLVTGDVTDNAQRNELAWARTLLDGGTATPDSGARGYQGVQAADDPDPFYYRPGVDPPRHPGLLARAQRPVRSPGLRRWLGVPGNHDVLLQGELAADARTDQVATGGRLVTSLDPRARLPQVDTASQAVDALLGAAEGGRTIDVAPDPDRAHAANADVVRALANGAATRAADRADYVTDVATANGGGTAEGGSASGDAADGGGVRVVALDTSSRTRGQGTEVLPEQLVWLRRQLDAAGGRPVVLMTHQPPADSVLRVLDESAATVLAVVHGDSHRNRVEPHGRYWVIGTSSLADWPMQARMIRVARTRDGYAIDTWMVDQDGAGDAGTARALSFVDAQGGRPKGYRGAVRDRNVRLFVARR